MVPGRTWSGRVPQIQIVMKTVESTVEAIVRVPQVECQAKIVERQVKTVEVPQIQERIIQQPMKQLVEKVVLAIDYNGAIV